MAIVGAFVIYDGIKWITVIDKTDLHKTYDFRISGKSSSGWGLFGQFTFSGFVNGEKGTIEVFPDDINTHNIGDKIAVYRQYGGSKFTYPAKVENYTPIIRIGRVSININMIIGFFTAIIFEGVFLYMKVLSWKAQAVL